MRMKATLNRADAAATRTSLARARAKPAAGGRTVDGGDHRLAQRPRAAARAWRCAAGPPCPPAAARARRLPGAGAGALQVEAGAEAPPGAGEDDDPHAPVAADLVEGGVQVGDELVAHRVQPLGPVQGEQGDARSAGRCVRRSTCRPVYSVAGSLGVSGPSRRRAHGAGVRRTRAATDARPVAPGRRRPDGPPQPPTGRSGGRRGHRPGRRRGATGPRPSDGAVDVDAWGPGAGWLVEHAPDLLGVHDDVDGWPDLAAAHPVLRRLAREHPGFRLGRSLAVYEALVPTILAQKVTGREARRSWAPDRPALGRAGAGPVPLAPPAGPRGARRRRLPRAPPARRRAQAGRDAPRRRPARPPARGDRRPASAPRRSAGSGPSPASARGRPPRSR